MDALHLETLVQKVGGYYSLVKLFQRRLRELGMGLPPLVRTNSSNAWEIVAEEILQDKVSLVTGEAAERMREEEAEQEIVALPLPLPARKLTAAS